MQTDMPGPAQPSRQQIEQLLGEGRWSEARFALETLWREEPSGATAQFVIAGFERMRGSIPLERRRVAILRSFTVEPLIPMLRAASLLAGGLDLEVRTGNFNTYVQEMVGADSFLYGFEPHAVILAVQGQDLAPELWDGYADLGEAQEAEVIERVLEDLEAWIRTFRRRTAASLMVHNFEQPDVARHGLLASLGGRSQRRAIERLNEGLRRMASTYSGVYPFDYDALVARYGRRGWHDDRKWFTVRFPVSSAHAPRLAEEWVRYLVAIFGKTAKVLVTDLDNTLWRGVVGEDGPEGIEMNGQYPGVMHRNLQRVLLDLYHRGILLAISSKNNEAEAMKVLREHPDMLLRPEHFAAIRCNWLDKAQNLRSIAQELQVGLDSLVFVDDNPAERDLVRRQAPEVRVIELPPHPMGYAAAVQEFPLFERVALSKEDQRRGQYYAEQRQRRELQQQAGSLEDYYRGLEQQVEIRTVRRETIPRVAQLTQKTNQFNLTTRRYSEGEIAALLETPGVNVYEVRVKDRFGDNGLVGVCITRQEGRICEIDTLLLSCRVIGRTVETAVLSFVADQSARQGAARLQGWFIPTRKNGPAEAFYPSHGFERVCENGASSLWSLELAHAPIECPGWISLAAETENATRDTLYCR